MHNSLECLDPKPCMPFSIQQGYVDMFSHKWYCLLLSHELDIFWWVTTRIPKKNAYVVTNEYTDVLHWGFLLPSRGHLPYAAPSRNYPMRFGWKLLQLRNLMLRDHSQPPSKRWDFTFEDMAAMLTNLDWLNSWDEANIGSVCHYLRGSKDLVLPPEIRAIIPISI